MARKLALLITLLGLRAGLAALARDPPLLFIVHGRKSAPGPMSTVAVAAVAASLTLRHSHLSIQARPAINGHAPCWEPCLDRLCAYLRRRRCVCLTAGQSTTSPEEAVVRCIAQIAGMAFVATPLLGCHGLGGVGCLSACAVVQSAAGRSVAEAGRPVWTDPPRCLCNAHASRYPRPLWALPRSSRTDQFVYPGEEAVAWICVRNTGTIGVVDRRPADAVVLPKRRGHCDDPLQAAAQRRRAGETDAIRPARQLQGGSGRRRGGVGSLAPRISRGSRSAAASVSVLWSSYQR